ncbi:MAG: hypothetical protein AAF355_03475 [Myxococcota bacterium]
MTGQANHWLSPRDKAWEVPQGIHGVVVNPFPGCEAVLIRPDGTSLTIPAAGPRTFASAFGTMPTSITARSTRDRKVRVDSFYAMRATAPANPARFFEPMLRALPEGINGLNGIFGPDTLALHPSRPDTEIDNPSSPHAAEEYRDGLVVYRNGGHLAVVNAMLSNLYGPASLVDAHGSRGFSDDRVGTLMRDLDLHGFGVGLRRDHRGEIVGLEIHWKSRGVNCVRDPRSGALVKPDKRHEITAALRKLYRGPITFVEDPPVACPR